MVDLILTSNADKVGLSLKQLGKDGQAALKQISDGMTALGTSLGALALASDQAAARVERAGAQMTARYRTASDAYAQEIAEINDLLVRQAISQQTADAARDDAVLRRMRASKTAVDGAKVGLYDYVEKTSDVAGRMNGVMVKAMDATEDYFVKLATGTKGGTVAFRAMVNSVIADLTRMVAQQAILTPLSRGISALLTSIFGGDDPLKNGPPAQKAPIPPAGSQQAGQAGQAGPAGQAGEVVAKAEQAAQDAQLSDRERLNKATDWVSGARSGLLDYIDKVSNSAVGMRRVLGNTMQATEDLFVGIVTGTKGATSAFKQMANSIINDLIRIIMQKTVIAPIASGIEGMLGSVFGGGGGGGGGATATMPTSGGGSWLGSIVSSIGSWLGFASGGYHSGGLRLVGEAGPELEATGPARIWNASQTARLLNGAAASSGDVVVNVFDQRQGSSADPVGVKQSTGSGGMRQIDIMIAEKVNQAVRSGQLDGALSDTFGLRRQGVRRG